jgi:hypothetical protein
VRLDVRGLGRDGTTLVRGVVGELKIDRGATRRAELWLECFGACQGDPPPPRGRDAGFPADAGAQSVPGDAATATPPDAPTAPDSGGSCGNGKLDPRETCDIAIPSGLPGACPPASCDDGITCTADTRVGSACAAQCLHAELRTFDTGDRCCPAGGTHADDPDCSRTCGNGTIEPGESCDTGMPVGLAGSCPLASDCVDAQGCTLDVLISAGTCSARCTHLPITTLAAGDGCCPVGGTHSNDTDCPVVCGNGVVEPAEICDTGLASGRPGACPRTCDDGQSCTADTLEGGACRATCVSRPITQYVNGDGCCPPLGNRTVDIDCPAACGNALVEPGETCDRAIAPDQPGACPLACAEQGAACMPVRLEGSALECTARCAARAILTCAAVRDGCCPAGCNALSDGDCSPTCGNGAVEPGETCDLGIAVGQAASCPDRCNDGIACTLDALVSAGTCSARCQATPITDFVPGDGCCPTGGNQNVDSDCPVVCGNQVVEGPRETCDKAIKPGAAGTCPTQCPPAPACFRSVLAGETAACTARCRIEAVTSCASGDGCCPAGCNRTTDGDCPAICGNAVVEPGESCDKGITAGNVGACPASCDDGDPCTTEAASGRVEDCTRTCAGSPVTACSGGDRCCPATCNPATDADCSATCGNGTVEKGETCDPPGACPTMCPDDGDSCTAEKLQGDPLTCTAVCRHVPITMCSDAQADRCCPTGCSPKQDLDCVATP